jgi:hypothetical protein
MVTEGVVVEAITINDADDINNDFESRLTEETQRLQQDLDTKLRQQQEEARELERNEREVILERKNKRRKKRCIILVVLCLAAIAGVATYFATSQGDDPELAKNTFDTVTKAPSAPVATWSPSSDLILYEPPSLGTCKSISQGKPVEGQSEMITESFIVSFEASLTSDLDVSQWLPDLKLIMQEKLMPLLVGCPDKERRLLRYSAKAFAFRTLEDFDESILGNAQIDKDYGKANTCSGGKASCQRFDLKIDISSKDTVENSSELISKHIDDVFNMKSSLSEYFQVDQTIETLEVRSVESYKPTVAPSLGLTPSTPSDYPSTRPSSTGTVKTEDPTFAPMSSPTVITDVPTFAPTPSPTVLTVGPTFAPTPSPTNRPTLAPTLAPTPSPTFAPTPSPTFAPTPSPTFAPTPSPTSAPTLSFAPSPSPTLTPSTSPSTFREGLLMDLLAPHSLQKAASEWIISVDTWSPPSAVDRDFLYLQRYALANIFFEAGGPDNPNLNIWLSANSICDWDGIYCNNDEYVEAIDLRKCFFLPRLPWRGIVDFFLMLLALIN